MSKNGQDPNQPLAAQGSNESAPPAPPGPVQQSGSGIPGAKPKGAADPADPKSQSGSGPAAGGPNPKPAVDPARQSAIDAACVQVCTSTVQAYRTGTIDRPLATHKILLAVFRTGRADPKNTEPWLNQLDDHDAVCATAAAVAQGSNPPATGGSAGGDPVAATGAQGSKRKRGDDDKHDDSGSDSDGDDERNSRRSYKPSAAGFRNAIFTGGPVSPHVQKTLDTRDNYSADLKQAKRDILRGGQCPPFPAELLDAALCDNPVDFNKIYAARFSSTADNGSEHLLADGLIIRFPIQRVKKQIVDQSDWELCYNSWFDITCFLFPHRRSELLCYHEYVLELFSSLHKSFHSRILSADVHMRNTIQGDPRASFFDRDRLQTCALRFISPWGAESAGQSHNQSASSLSRSSRPTGSARSGTSGELCRNWNRGRCDWENCRHGHFCTRPGCGGAHPECEHDKATSGGKGGGKKQ